MLSVDEVLQVIAEKVVPVAAQRIPLPEARGCVLAEDVRMGEDSPRFDRAIVDGFALRSTDSAPGVELELIGNIDAGGAAFPGVVGTGQCVGINTGAVMPAGADAVLMVEQSERITRGNKEFTRTNNEVLPGQGLQKKGADARAGDLLLHAGVTLGAAQLAACAAAGIGQPLVRRARVAVLTTGDEIVDAAGSGPAAALAPGKIWNSNRPMLCALVEACGGELLDLGSCGDEHAEIRDRLARGLSEADLVVVSGGMSMGTRDLVPVVLRELGVAPHVEKVRIKPGKPFLLGIAEPRCSEGKKYVAGLPGNPVSAFVTFQRFVREMIGRITGSSQAAVTMITATVEKTLEENGDREFYQPCVLSWRGGSLTAEPLAWKGSADLFTLARANALLVRPIGAKRVEAGEQAAVMSWHSLA